MMSALSREMGPGWVEAVVSLLCDALQQVGMQGMGGASAGRGTLCEVSLDKRSQHARQHALDPSPNPPVGVAEQHHHNCPSLLQGEEAERALAAAAAEDRKRGDSSSSSPAQSPARKQPGGEAGQGQEGSGKRQQEQGGEQEQQQQGRGAPGDAVAGRTEADAAAGVDNAEDADHARARASSKEEHMEQAQQAALDALRAHVAHAFAVVVVNAIEVVMPGAPPPAVTAYRPSSPWAPPAGPSGGKKHGASTGSGDEAMEEARAGGAPELPQEEASAGRHAAKEQGGEEGAEGWQGPDGLSEPQPIALYR